MNELEKMRCRVMLAVLVLPSLRKRHCESASAFVVMLFFVSKHEIHARLFIISEEPGRNPSPHNSTRSLRQHLRHFPWCAGGPFRQGHLGITCWSPLP